jgi:hypothetical protein
MKSSKTNNNKEIKKNKKNLKFQWNRQRQKLLKKISMKSSKTNNNKEINKKIKKIKKIKNFNEIVKDI